MWFKISSKFCSIKDSFSRHITPTSIVTCIRTAHIRVTTVLYTAVSISTLILLIFSFNIKFCIYYLYLIGQRVSNLSRNYKIRNLMGMAFQRLKCFSFIFTKFISLLTLITATSNIVLGTCSCYFFVNTHQCHFKHCTWYMFLLFLC